MLRIEQMESTDKRSLIVIDLNLKGTVKFHGVFEPCDIDESTLRPMENGLKMEIGLED